MIASHQPVAHVEVGGRRVETDSEGYLVDRSQWSEELARELARREELALTPAHWEVVRFLREYFFSPARDVPARRSAEAGQPPGRTAANEGGALDDSRTRRFAGP